MKSQENFIPPSFENVFLSHTHFEHQHFKEVTILCLTSNSMHERLREPIVVSDARLLFKISQTIISPLLSVSANVTELLRFIVNVVLHFVFQVSLEDNLGILLIEFFTQSSSEHGQKTTVFLTEFKHIDSLELMPLRYQCKFITLTVASCLIIMTL